MTTTPKLIELLDGRILVDVSPFAQEARIPCAVALTRAVWQTCVSAPSRNSDRDENAWLRDILGSLALAMPTWAVPEPSFYFGVILPDEAGMPTVPVRLKEVYRPNELGQPTITVMLASEPDQAVPTINMEAIMTNTMDIIRHQRLIDINAEPGSRTALEAKHGRVWETSELAADFDVLGFLAPYVAVRRKSDGRKGSLEFQHNPRFYFDFVPDEG